MDLATTIAQARYQDDCKLTATVLRGLPEKVTELRKKRNLSFRKAAEEIGIAASTLKEYEDRIRGCEVMTVILILEWVANPMYQDGRLF